MLRNILIINILFALGCKPTAQVATPEYKQEIADYIEKYKADFLLNDRGPLKETDFENLDFYAADPNFDCDCKVDITSDEKPFDVKTYSGAKKQYLKYATANCKVNGSKVKLALYKPMKTIQIPAFSHMLFLPYMDTTNGEETYGGGRYINLSTKDITKDMMLNIDFNKSYNPYCAFSDGYNCPIPPVENHLDVAINAGEKNFKGKVKKRVVQNSNPTYIDIKK